MDKISAARRLAALDLAGHIEPAQKSKLERANFRDDMAVDGLETDAEFMLRRQLRAWLPQPGKGQVIEADDDCRGHWVELPPWTDENGTIWSGGKHFVSE